RPRPADVHPHAEIRPERLLDLRPDSRNNLGRQDVTLVELSRRGTVRPRLVIGITHPPDSVDRQLVVVVVDLRDDEPVKTVPSDLDVDRRRPFSDHRNPSRGRFPTPLGRQGGSEPPQPVHFPSNLHPPEGQVGLEEVLSPVAVQPVRHVLDRKSTRLNSSHVSTSYAVFCVTKK